MNDSPENPNTPALSVPLPAMGEIVPLSRIKEICAAYGLHTLWAKIERDPEAPEVILTVRGVGYKAGS